MQPLYFYAKMLYFTVFIIINHSHVVKCMAENRECLPFIMRTYGIACEQVYSTHWSTRIPCKIFCEARRVTYVWCASEQITCARNYARELCYTWFVRTNAHSHARWIARANKFACKSCHEIRTKLLARVPLLCEWIYIGSHLKRHALRQWQPP